MLLGSTVVLRRRFDPEDCLRAVTEEDCDSLVVIPVMLQRILQLPQETLDRYDLGRVKVVAASGSALPGDLGTHWMDQFGDNALQHLRLDRGRLRDDRDPAGPPRGARDGRQAAVRHGGEDLRRRGQRAAAGRVRPDLRRQRHPLRGLHRRRPQGHARRADELRRRRPLRRAGPAVRRGPRRRDDRLRRRERLPQGGRGLPRPPRRGRTRPRRSASTTTTSASGCGVRRARPRKDAVTEDDLKAYVKDNLARYKVPREIVFLDELPRNATGKILKRDLDRRRTRGPMSDRHGAAGRSGSPLTSSSGTSTARRCGCRRTAARRPWC